MSTRSSTSQLPFGSVPFRHSSSASRSLFRLRSSSLNFFSAQCPFGTFRWFDFTCCWPGLSVSITFRLSALSARARGATGWYCVALASQLPFGSVPFRHTQRNLRGRLGIREVSITFRLSALSAREVRCMANTVKFYESQLPFGSVPFRHTIKIKVRDRPDPVSITFRLSALSALERLRGGQALDRGTRLNYLSAQCPFGTPRLT